MSKIILLLMHFTIFLFLIVLGVSICGICGLNMNFVAALVIYAIGWVCFGTSIILQTLQRQQS